MSRPRASSSAGVVSGGSRRITFFAVPDFSSSRPCARDRSTIRPALAINKEVDLRFVLGYTPLESWANFVLFGGVDDPHATFEALLEHDIIIRDVGIPNHLRVTAGTQAETTAFLKALASLSDRADEC